MNCSRVQENFDEFYSHEINSETAELIQQHINKCDECRREYSAYAVLKTKAQSLKKEFTPSKNLFDNIEKQISYQNQNVMKNDIQIKPLSGNILTIDFNEEKKPLPTEEKQSFISRNWYWFASAAAVLLIVSLVISRYSEKNIYTAGEMSNWKLVNLKGNALINGVKSDVVNVGDWIQTDGETSVILKIANVGDINIEPNSKVRFIQSDDSQSRIEVAYGTVNTSTSQADKFVLQTSNMKVQDKGSSYSFKVDDKGNGVIYVNNGIANIESGNRVSVVPEGKFCMYKPEFGVGIPFRKDAKPEFQNAIFQYDFNNGGQNAIYSAIASAMPEDYYSLLNLIPRVDEKTKYLVLNKLGRIAPNGVAGVRLDSLDDFDNENIEDCIEKVRDHIRVHVNFDREELEREMSELSKDLAEMKFNFSFDGKKLAEDIRKEMQSLKIDLEEMKKDFSDSSFKYNEYMKGMSEFDQAEFEKDMEKMQIELKESLGDMQENFKKSFDGKNFNFNFKFDSLNVHLEGLKELEKLKHMDWQNFYDAEDLKELESLKGMKIYIDSSKGKHGYYYKYNTKDDEQDLIDEKEEMRKEREMIEQEKEEMRKEKEEMEKEKRDNK